MFLYALILLAYSSTIFGMSSFNNYDPFPLFSTANPHEFLQTSQREQLRGLEPEIKDERVNLTISPFAQWANNGENLHKEQVELGDLRGPWNMLALLYNSENCVVTSPVPCGDLLLGQTPQQIYRSISGIPFCTTDDSLVYFGDPTALSNPEVTANVGPNFGKVSVPLRYRKHGVRGEAAIRIFEDVGLKLQVGFADIHQVLTVSGYLDLGHFDTKNMLGCPIDACAQGGINTVTCYGVNLTNVRDKLTNQDAVPAVADLFGIDVCDFKKAGIEDLRGQIFVRHAFEFNENREGWPRFLLTPFVQVIGALGVAAPRNWSKALAVQFNNNGHDAFGFNTGLSLDFVDSLELVVEGGGTFFSHECYRGFRMPTHPDQSGLFPCVTTVNYKPGATWNLIGTLHARRFLERLSAFVQFGLFNHEEDDFKVRQPVDCQQYFPEVLKCGSEWSLLMFNGAFNYDISPNISLGVLWQFPLKRRNAPKSKTLIGSVVANF